VTEPNSDPELTLAARKLVKTWMTPAFAKDIDNGDLDAWGLMDRARAQLLREAHGEGLIGG
jgi:hypothetical protein